MQMPDLFLRSRLRSHYRSKSRKAKAYELIALERIRAYKMEGKTMIDLDSLDEDHASLPRGETRAS